jgi:hypothetical protein
MATLTFRLGHHIFLYSLSFFNWAIFFFSRLDKEIELPSELGITYDSLVTRDFLGDFFLRRKKSPNFDLNNLNQSGTSISLSVEQ